MMSCEDPGVSSSQPISLSLLFHLLGLTRSVTYQIQMSASNEGRRKGLNMGWRHEHQASISSYCVDYSDCLPFWSWFIEMHSALWFHDAVTLGSKWMNHVFMNWSTVLSGKTISVASTCSTSVTWLIMIPLFFCEYCFMISAFISPSPMHFWGQLSNLLTFRSSSYQLASM